MYWAELQRFPLQFPEHPSVWQLCDLVWQHLSLQSPLSQDGWIVANDCLMKVSVCARFLKSCFSFLLQAKDIPGARNNASVKERNSIFKLPCIIKYKQYKFRKYFWSFNTVLKKIIKNRNSLNTYFTFSFTFNFKKNPLIIVFGGFRRLLKWFVEPKLKINFNKNIQSDKSYQIW